MSLKPNSSQIECILAGKKKASSSDRKDIVEYAVLRTADMRSRLDELHRHLSAEEKEQAAKFSLETFRNTYIASHGILREVLSEKLGTDPDAIDILPGKHKKPFISGNPCYFNISHTRDAFALAFSRNQPIGIDIEERVRKVDPGPVMKIVFSEAEKDYVLAEQSKELERFFILWTRKEALMKAIGLGIIDELKELEVASGINYISRELLQSYQADIRADRLTVHSENHKGIQLSLASWGRPEFRMLELESSLPN